MELQKQYKDILYDSKIISKETKNSEFRRAFFMGKSGMGKSYCFERLCMLGKIDSHYGGEMEDQYLKYSKFQEQEIIIHIFDTVSIDFLEIDFQRENKIRNKVQVYDEYKELFQQGFNRIFLFVKYDRLPIMKENLKTVTLQLKQYKQNITLIVTQAPFEEKQIQMEEFNSITGFYNISQNVIVIGKYFDIDGLRQIILSHMWDDQLIKDFQIEGTLFDIKFCNDMSKETKECFLQFQQQIKGIQCQCSGNHKNNCKYYLETKVGQKWSNDQQQTFEQPKPISTQSKQMDKQQSQSKIVNHVSQDNKEVQEQQHMKESIQEANLIQNQSSLNSNSQNYNQNQSQQSQEAMFDLGNYFSIPIPQNKQIKQNQYKILFTGFKNNNKQTIFNRLQNNQIQPKQNQYQFSYLYNSESFTVMLQSDLTPNKQQTDNLSSIKSLCYGFHKIYLFIDVTQQDTIKQSFDLLHNIGVSNQNITLVLNNAVKNKKQSEVFKCYYNVIYDIEELELDNIQKIIFHDINISKQLDPIMNIAHQRTQNNIQQNGFNHRK